MTEREIDKLREKLRNESYMASALKTVAEKLTDIFVPKGENKNGSADKAKA